jgi:hypothetical protein
LRPLIRHGRSGIVAEATPRERPKVSVAMNVGPGLLGKRLDQMKVIDPKIIEHSASR